MIFSRIIRGDAGAAIQAMRWNMKEELEAEQKEFKAYAHHVDSICKEFKVQLEVSQAGYELEIEELMQQLDECTQQLLANTSQLSASNHVEESIRVEYKSRQRRVARKRLKMVLGRVCATEIQMRLRQWGRNISEDREDRLNVERVRFLDSEETMKRLQRQTLELVRDATLKRVGTIFAGWMQKSSLVCIRNWSLKVRDKKMLDSTKTVMKASMANAQKKQQQVKLTLASKMVEGRFRELIRSDISTITTAFRRNMYKARRAEMELVAKNSAIRQIQMTMVRITRGVLGVAVQRLRANTLHYFWKSKLHKQVRFAEKQSQDMSVSWIKIVFFRMFDRDVVQCLSQWQTNTNNDIRHSLKKAICFLHRSPISIPTLTLV